MATPDRHHVLGWDVGGAHVKACLLRDGSVIDVAQWACPLWQGLEDLEQVLASARARWAGFDEARHALTMTGEMTDLFEHREDGVRRIAAALARTLAPGPSDTLRFYAGDAGWCAAADAAAHWPQIASANWLATATHAARCMPEGVLIDIGSTTTDLIAWRDGRVLGTSRSVADRLASGELVYQGVVRTPLCALGPRIAWRGRELNVMNEFFATTADVYRLTGELDAAHDLHPSADNAPKDAAATRRRLARMIGVDERDASPDEWLAFARAWRERQVDELAGQLRRVERAHGLSPAAIGLGAGCGDFLVGALLARAGAPSLRRRYAEHVARIAPDARPGVEAATRWVQVCAPAVAVAALFDSEQR